ncbi:MAG: hemerythrin domain-containing protein [Gammaproteobacteria bacterium]
MDTICEHLARDHAHCDQLFGQACADVRAGRWSEAGVSAAALAHALRFHLDVEEQLVFGAFDEAFCDAASPTRWLRIEHQRLLGVLVRVEHSVAARDGAAFFKHAATLRAMLQYHHEKEEAAFYPMAERVLAGRKGELIDALGRMQQLGPHRALLPA